MKRSSNAAESNETAPAEIKMKKFDTKKSIKIDVAPKTEYRMPNLATNARRNDQVLKDLENNGSDDPKIP